jgi:hypothetical protein
MRICLALLLGLMINFPARSQQAPIVPADQAQKNAKGATDSAGKPLKNLTKVTPLDGDDEPVKVTCQKFNQSDDWLKDLTIEVENSSGKSISYLECTVMICDVNGLDCIAIPLIYGKVVSKKIDTDDISEPEYRPKINLPPAAPPVENTKRRKNGKQPLTPEVAPQKAPAEEEFKPIAPGAKIKLAVTEGAYNSAKKLIEKNNPINSINNADLIVAQARYTDGSGWTSESLFANASINGYKNGENAYMTAKEGYVWGYLRERKNTFGDIYSGPIALEDDKGGKNRIQGYSRKIPRSQRVIIFSSGGS